MIATLVKIAGQCDGVRCDMAMLVLPDVFERTWGVRAEPFWPRAIARVREHAPGFYFMAEVYWDLEWTLQQQGFDYTYDKRLYDRLREGTSGPSASTSAPPWITRTRWPASWKTTTSRARLQRSARRSRGGGGHHVSIAGAALLSSGAIRRTQEADLSPPGSRTGRGCGSPAAAVLRPSPESAAAPAVREGEWQLLECRPAWEGNWTSDGFVAYAWQGRDGTPVVVTVNNAPHQAQCYVALPLADLVGAEWRLSDQLEGAVYDRDGGDLHNRGLYVDAPRGRRRCSHSPGSRQKPEAGHGHHACPQLSRESTVPVHVN